MINDPPVRHSFKRISWTAVFVGALIGIGLSFLLNLFALAIGLSAFTVSTAGVTSLAVGSIIGIAIGLIASMTVAGYAAGYLGRLYCPMRNLGIIYGFTTWSLALVLSALVATHISQYVTSYAHAVLGTELVVTSEKNDTSSVSVHTQEATKNADGKSIKNQKVTSINVTPGSLASGACILFVLCFIGAISSCCGACWAMSCKRDD